MLTSQALALLLIPLFFSLFMAVSAERAWSFYLSLQIITNIHNFQEILIMPATSWPILRILQKISSFKLTEEPLVKSWIKLHIEGNCKKFMLIDTFILSIIGLLALLLIAYVLSKVKKHIKQEHI